MDTANGVIHVVDTVLLPKPFGRRQAVLTLEDAIRRGVPVFNNGNHRECAEIYTTACQTIVDSGSDQVPHSVMSVLQKTLDRAKHINHSTLRAWALRHGMDSAYTVLGQESSANSSASSNNRSAEGKERIRFAFDRPEAAAQWQTTNDGVMESPRK